MENIGTDILELVTLSGKQKYDRKEVMAHYRLIFDQRSEFARELMRQFAIVQAQPDGEDSTGRQKLMLATPVDVVQRACDITELAFAEFDKRGWIAKVAPVETFFDKLTGEKNG